MVGFRVKILSCAILCTAFGGCGVTRQTVKPAIVVPTLLPQNDQKVSTETVLQKERFTAQPEKSLEVVLVLAEGPRAATATPAVADIARRLGEVWATRGPDVFIHVLAPVALTPVDSRVSPQVVSLTPAEASALSLGDKRRNLEPYIDLSPVTQLEIMVVGEDEVLARNTQDFAEAARTQIEERHQGFALAHTPLVTTPLEVLVDGRPVEPTLYHVDSKTRLLRFHPDFGLSQGARIEIAYYTLFRKY